MEDIVTWEAILRFLSGLTSTMISGILILAGVLVLSVIVFHLLRLVYFVMELVSIGIWAAISEYLDTASTAFDRQILLYVLFGCMANGLHVVFQLLNIAIAGYAYIPAFIASVCLLTANAMFLYALYRKGLERYESQIRERVLRDGLRSRGLRFGKSAVKSGLRSGRATDDSSTRTNWSRERDTELGVLHSDASAGPSTDMRLRDDINSPRSLPELLEMLSECVSEFEALQDRMVHAMEQHWKAEELFWKAQDRGRSYFYINDLIGKEAQLCHDFELCKQHMVRLMSLKDTLSSTSTETYGNQSEI